MKKVAVTALFYLSDEERRTIAAVLYNEDRLATTSECEHFFQMAGSGALRAAVESPESIRVTQRKA